MQFIELPHIRNSFFVTHHHDFNSATDGASVVAARAATAARSLLRVNQLACSRLANRHADAAEGSGHVEVGVGERLLLHRQHARQIDVHEASSDQADECGDQQRDAGRVAVVVRHEISAGAEPRDEDDQARDVEWRRQMKRTEVNVQRHMEMQMAAEEERHRRDE